MTGQEQVYEEKQEFEVIDTEKNQEMKVDVSEETKTTEIYETKNHIFKINSEKLDNLREKENFIKKIATRIQKSMKQKGDKITGKEWEISYRLILHEITDQWTLEEEKRNGI
jgi:hypothetical protein